MDRQSAVRYLFILQKEGEREGGTNRQILTQIERKRVVQIDKYLHR